MSTHLYLFTYLHSYLFKCLILVVVVEHVDMWRKVFASCC